MAPLLACLSPPTLLLTPVWLGLQSKGTSLPLLHSNTAVYTPLLLGPRNGLCHGAQPLHTFLTPGLANWLQLATHTQARQVTTARCHHPANWLQQQGWRQLLAASQQRPIPGCKAGASLQDGSFQQDTQFAISSMVERSRWPLLQCQRHAAHKAAVRRHPRADQREWHRKATEGGLIPAPAAEPSADATAVLPALHTLCSCPCRRCSMLQLLNPQVPACCNT
jgi:hypothetical protein